MNPTSSFSFLIPPRHFFLICYDGIFSFHFTFTCSQMVLGSLCISCHRSGWTILICPFWTGLFHWAIMVSNWIHLDVTHQIPFFLWVSRIPFVPHFLYPPISLELLAWVRILSIVNCATINMGVHVLCFQFDGINFLAGLLALLLSFSSSL